MKIYELYEENITREQLLKLEYYLDLLFKKNNINVEFTKHFLDRVNDTRNIRQISVNELSQLFTDSQKKYGDRLEHSTDGWEAVLKDIRTDVNMPFVLNYNEKNGMIDLVSKTVMRKKDFKSVDPLLKVW